MDNPILNIGSGPAITYGDAFLGFHNGQTCMAYQISEKDLEKILGNLSGDVQSKQQFPPTEEESQVVMRFLVGGDIFEEIRLDYPFKTALKFGLPGLIKLGTEGEGRLSLLLGGSGRNLDQLALALTLDKGSEFSLMSDFSWLTGNDRELFNDASEKDTASDPLFKLTFKVKGEAATLILFSLDLSTEEWPRFLLRPESPLLPLNYSNAETLCTPISNLAPFRNLAGFWDVDFNLNLGSDGEFELPFLKELDQYLRVFKPDNNDDPKIDFARRVATFALGIEIKIGDDFSILSAFEARFNWDRFALEIDHENGIDLTLTQDQIDKLNDPEKGIRFLGMKWIFKPGEKIMVGGEERYQLFKITTKSNNFGIVMAEGAHIDLAFEKITEEPIVFRTTDFSITPAGFKLDTEVINSAVRINGLDTKFTFDGTGIKIERSKIKSFTIAGEGPLPPALVGEATAFIYLAFGPAKDSDNLTLLEGRADLKGDKLLDCKASRFQFEVSQIGLNFVSDGRFHLYFTLTGKARFVLAPGDASDGPLALLPNIEMEMVECPLTGDASVIGKHVNFLIELPKPISFNFLGAFELELRAIGFVPQFEPLGGVGAMHLTGQLLFAQGVGDVGNPKPDYHKLYIALPEEGSFIPRIYFTQLPVNINMGSAFRLNGVVEFKNETNVEGFIGEGEIQIQGLPTLAGSFGFLRVRRDETSPWVRAWFIYVEARKISFMIPVIQIYIREIGMGFGYRFTLVSFKAADQIDDTKELLAELTKLSRTQGNLANRDQWAVDLEPVGSSLRWTIVFRALISQMSAAPSPLSYNEASERTLPNLFLFDVVVAFRSDLTFLMTARGWLNTNYNDLLVDPSIRSKPFVSGFILLQPTKKRFLAHVASNPDGHLGSNPELPDFVKQALKGIKFSATLLIEPSLLHFELGWPNSLGWDMDLGVVKVQCVGGFIFRISPKEFVMGINYIARGVLDVNVEFDAGVVGLSISAYASVGYGARYIGVIGLENPITDSAYYGAISLEINVKISIKFWISLAFVTLKFKFSVAIHFSASVELGVRLDALPGARARGTIALAAMGRRISFSAKIGVNEETVDSALNRTKGTLDLGLTAGDVEKLPGLGEGQNDVTQDLESFEVAGLEIEPVMIRSVQLPKAIADLLLDRPVTPEYTTFAIRDGVDKFCYFVIMPKGDLETENRGFLPVPPIASASSDSNKSAIGGDFEIRLPEAVPNLEHFKPGNQKNEEAGQWGAAEEEIYTWRANWAATYISGVQKFEEGEGDAPPKEVDDPISFTFADYLQNAYVKNDAGELVDPFPIMQNETHLVDERILDPNENAFEDAVIGAVEQFRGSPHFKRDPNYEYDRILDAAFSAETTVYNESGDAVDDEKDTDANQQALQIRGMVIHDIISDLREYVEIDQESARESFVASSIPFQLGLVFRVPTTNCPDWLDQNVAETKKPKILQRLGGEGFTEPSEAQSVDIFNVRGTEFFSNPPEFENVRHYTDSHSVAITWDLTWQQAPAANCTMCQASPEHHLLHYRVSRRDLEGQAPEKVVTVKPAQVLHLERPENKDPLLYSLKPKFQFIDHFTEETREEQINLPADGRSFLYTITPVDYSGTVGRPLTLIATRFPDTPPLVPTDGQLLVNYRLRKEEAALPANPTLSVPPVLTPHKIVFRWSEPQPAPDRPSVGIKKYNLVFRREETIPVGSYGLDSSTNVSRSKSLPSTNARPRPTDIIIEDLPAAGPANRRTAEVSFAQLQAQGIAPRGKNPIWESESWQIFAQTVSINGVPSSLVPVQLVLRLENVLGQFDPLDDIVRREYEERQPADLEWLPRPLKLPALPPEDMDSITGIAHFPMPTGDIESLGQFDFTDSVLENVKFNTHPKGIRSIRFRWNQAPSHIQGYPLNLIGGYDLYELNIDAQTTETLNPTRKFGLETTQFTGTFLEIYGDELNRDWFTERRTSLDPSTQLDFAATNPVFSGASSLGVRWTRKFGYVEFRLKDESATISLDTVAKLTFSLFTGGVDIGLRVSMVNNNDRETNFVEIDEYPPGWQQISLDLSEFGETEYLGFRIKNGSDMESPPQFFIDNLALVSADFMPVSPPELGERDRFQDALRHIQEIQMLPADDLLLAPGDTLVPNLWEAWYPSMMVRRRDDQADPIPAPQVPTSPWHTWRESYLEWPKWRKLTETTDGRREKQEDMLHPYLMALIDALTLEPQEPVTEGEPEPPAVTKRTISLQVSPPFQEMDLATLFESTPTDADPYGWGILQRLGLSMTFSLWDFRTGELVLGDELVNALHEAINRASEPLENSESSENFKEILKHLHVELLFQPGKSIALGENEVTAADMLGLVQVSLRPIPAQRLRYNRMRISGGAQDAVHLEILTPSDEMMTLVNTTQRADGPVEIDPKSAKAASPVVFRASLPFNGKTDILFRSLHDFGEGEKQNKVVLTARVKKDFGEIAKKSTVKNYFRYKEKPHRAVFIQPVNDDDAEKAKLKKDLESYSWLADVVFDLTPVPFEVTEDFANYFLAPENLAALASKTGNPVGDQWRKFKKYVEALNPAGEVNPNDENRIFVPTDEDSISDILFDFMLWSQRFFDHSPARIAKAWLDTGSPQLVESATVATAYPRVTSPAFATPDDGGRLTYNHLIEDKWAHTYRYYFQPYGRYDLLWNGLRDSTQLFPDLAEEESKEVKFSNIARPVVVIPEEHVGGLDVVLERISPVSSPFILSSGRLDPATTIGTQAEPGKTWEVLIAQHPEQSLMEKNQTLARNLSFRQVSFTVLRRFAYDDWKSLLDAEIKARNSDSGEDDFVALGSPIELIQVANEYPDVPTSFPDKLDHIDLDHGGEKLTPNELSSLSLPKRVSRFQQGVTAVQFDGLPFFYEHRLITVAQSDEIVSPINEVIQREFEYISPEPSGMMFGEDMTLEAKAGIIRGRLLKVPMKRLWDSLSDEAQAQWESENPDLLPLEEGRFSMRPGGLPDPEVVYQIVDFNRGNIEVQAEVFFTPDLEPDSDSEIAQEDTIHVVYQVTQLGKMFKILLDPQEPFSIPERPNEPFVLNIRASQRTEIPLSENYNLPVEVQRGGHLSIEQNVLNIYGVLDKQDVANLLGDGGNGQVEISKEADREAIVTAFNRWWTYEPFSREILIDPPNKQLDSRPAPACHLVWHGEFDDALKAELLALPGDSVFKNGMLQLAAQLEQRPELTPLTVGQVSVRRGPEQKVNNIPAGWTLAITHEPGLPPSVVWNHDGGGALRLVGPLASPAKFETLSWSGLLETVALEAIEPVWRNWADLSVLSSPLDEILARIGPADRSETHTIRPVQGMIDAVDDDLFDDRLANLLKIEEAEGTLHWDGDGYSADQDNAVSSLVARGSNVDTAFGEALKLLRTQLNGDFEALGPLEFVPSLDSVGGRLIVENGEPENPNEKKLIWKGAIPTAAELDALDQLIMIPPPAEPPVEPPTNDGDGEPPLTPPDGDGEDDTPIDDSTTDVPPPFVNEQLAILIKALKGQFEVAVRVPLEPINRPGAEDVPEILRDRLFLAPASVNLSGRLSTQEEVDAFTQFARIGLPEEEQYEASFQTAISAVHVAVMSTLDVTIDVDIPVRPSQAELPSGLARHLIIGRAEIGYHGIMSQEEGNGLQRLAGSPLESAAISRLYSRSIKNSLGRRRLQVRTRRGSATPSQRIDIQVDRLSALSEG